MNNRRRFPAVVLLIVFLGGLCGVHAADSGIRSPFSGKKIQQVQEGEPANASSPDSAESTSVTSDGTGIGSGEDTQDRLKDLKELKEKTLTVLTNTLRAIIDLLRQLIDKLKKFLGGNSATQPSQPTSGSTAAPAPEAPSGQVAAPEPASEQPGENEIAVTPEPVPEPSVESSGETVVPPQPPETPRGPTPAECERMKLLIAEGKAEDVAAMISKGFDINARIGEKGTALHYAVGAGNKAIVELLVKRGADLGARDDMNATPLHVAAWKNNPEFCRLFLDAGADVNITGWNAAEGSDRTPLHVASEVGACDVLRLFLARGANVNALDSKKQTPLYWAVFSGQVEAANILRERGGVEDPSKLRPAASPAVPAPPAP